MKTKPVAESAQSNPVLTILGFSDIVLQIENIYHMQLRHI